MKGFWYDNESDEYYGKFGGEECWVLVHSTAITNTVYGVTVVLNNDELSFKYKLERYLKLFKNYYEGVYEVENQLNPPLHTPHLEFPDYFLDLFNTKRGYYLFKDNYYQFATDDGVGIIELFSYRRGLGGGNTICINYYDVKNLKKRYKESEQNTANNESEILNIQKKETPKPNKAEGASDNRAYQTVRPATENNKAYDPTYGIKKKK